MFKNRILNGGRNSFQMEMLPENRNCRQGAWRGGGGAYLKGEENYSMFSEMRSNISFCICLQINQEPRSQAEYFQLFYIGCMEKFFLQNIRIDF